MTPLISASDVVVWIGADKIDTDAATSLAQAASDAVGSLIERDLSLLTGIVDNLDANGTNYVLLTRWPVQSVSSVTLNAQPVQPAAYGVPGWRLDAVNTRKLNFPGMGQLTRGVMNVAVVYSAGYDLTQPTGAPTGLPGALFQALRLTAGAIFNSQAADPNLASESTAGVFSGSFYPTGVGAVPPGARTLLLPYMRAAP